MNIGQVVSQLIAIAKADELAALLPALAAFFSSISVDHTVINLQLQLGKLEAAVLAAQPGVATAVLQQISADIQAQVAGAAKKP
jgi:hypothetical protein